MDYSLGIIFLILVSSNWAYVSGDDDSYPVVNISSGPIMGAKVVSSWTNKTYYAFQGIPYAEPPLGNLRFKEPQPVSNWTSVKDCSKNDSAWCMQSMFGGSSTISEDCLFINVYSPQTNVTSGALWPVMVWIHGGAYLSGSGSKEIYGPDMLVAEGVILVTMNYRLGAFGFLSLGIPDAPGNSGVKDQLFALKWVQREIEKFGGDPNRVTIFGQSAGSTSVHLQYLSPLSKGYFQAVIGESGTSLSDAAMENGTSHALSLAELLNCSTADATSALNCLLNASAEEIVTKQGDVSTDYVSNLRGDGLVWRPVVDKDASSEPFLPAMPLELYQQGQGSFVPFIMGSVKDEGVIEQGTDAEIESITNITILEMLVPDDVQAVISQAQLEEKAEEINAFYFNGTTPSSDTNISSYINLYTDVMIAYPTAQSARLFRTRGDVYLYHFIFDGAFKSPQSLQMEEQYNMSFVIHAEDLNYLFVIDASTQNTGDSTSMETWRRMVRLWTNFAKYGTPTTNIADDILEDLTWPPIDNTTLKYIIIDTDLTMVEDEDYMAADVALWDSVYSVPSAAGLPQGSSLAALLFVALVFRLSGSLFQNSYI